NKDNVKLYGVVKDNDRLQECLATQKPLTGEEEVFKDDRWVWVSEEGTHVAIDREHKIVAVVRITPWEKVQAVVKTTANTLMKWSGCVQPIESNSAHKTHAKGTDHRAGEMCGVGWHPAFYKGKSIAAYSPRVGREDDYKELVENGSLLKVLGSFRKGLASLYPGGSKSLEEEAFTHNVPHAAATEYDPEDSETETGPNCITVTHHGFCNRPHQDNDWSSAVYGRWWVAKKTDDGYTLDPEADHNQVKKGAFVFSEFGFGVDFERAKGLVEVFWRGCEDYHATMVPHETEQFTRFGTSMQLTRAVVNRIQKIGSHGVPPVKRVVTPADSLAMRAGSNSRKRR
ncbi:hypothetical protein PQX77_008956, partial [Marasmius sp. AFHP31]